MHYAISHRASLLNSSLSWDVNEFTLKNDVSISRYIYISTVCAQTFFPSLFYKLIPDIVTKPGNYIKKNTYYPVVDYI